MAKQIVKFHMISLLGHCDAEITPTADTAHDCLVAQQTLEYIIGWPCWIEYK